LSLKKGGAGEAQVEVRIVGADIGTEVGAGLGFGGSPWAPGVWRNRWEVGWGRGGGAVDRIDVVGSAVEKWVGLWLGFDVWTGLSVS
jgi:hypothetical protein